MIHCMLFPLLFALIANNYLDDSKYFVLKEQPDNKISLEFIHPDVEKIDCSITFTGINLKTEEVFENQECSKIPLVFTIRDPDEYYKVDIRHNNELVESLVLKVNSIVLVDIVGQIAHVDLQTARLRSVQSICNAALYDSEENKIDINYKCRDAYGINYDNNEQCIRNCHQFAITNLKPSKQYYLEVSVDSLINRTIPIKIGTSNTNIFVDGGRNEYYPTFSGDSGSNCLFTFKNNNEVVERKSQDCFSGYLFPEDVRPKIVSFTVSRNGIKLVEFLPSKVYFNNYPITVKEMLWVKNTLILDFGCKSRGKRCLYNFILSEFDSLDIKYHCYLHNYCIRKEGTLIFPNLDRSGSYNLIFFTRLATTLGIKSLEIHDDSLLVKTSGIPKTKKFKPDH